MEIRHATHSDIEELIQLRMRMLEDARIPDEATRRTLQKNLRDYLEIYLERDDFVALLGFEDNVPVTSALMLFQQNIPNFRMIHGRNATIYSVYTLPEYRRRGYAGMLVRRLMDIARQKKADVIDLLATEKGLPLYKELGFMELPLTPLYYTVKLGDDNDEGNP